VTETDRYDIVAKADAQIAPLQRVQAVMSLLEERFKLVSTMRRKKYRESRWPWGKSRRSCLPRKTGKKR
jgi:uncharacterized protein (TIGR03435 family)